MAKKNFIGSERLATIFTLIKNRLAGYLPLSGGTMTGNIITPASTTQGIYPATNNYGQVGSSSKKFRSMYATTFYGALSGTATNASYLATLGAITNLNDLYNTTGIKFGNFAATASNIPKAAAGTAIWIPYSTTAGVQIVTYYSDGSVYKRYKNGSTYGAWQQVYDDDYHPTANAAYTAYGLHKVYSYSGAINKDEYKSYWPDDDAVYIIEVCFNWFRSFTLDRWRANRVYMIDAGSATTEAFTHILSADGNDGLNYQEAGVYDSCGENEIRFYNKSMAYNATATIKVYQIDAG